MGVTEEGGTVRGTLEEKKEEGDVVGWKETPCWKKKREGEREDGSEKVTRHREGKPGREIEIHNVVVLLAG